MERTNMNQEAAFGTFRRQQRRPSNLLQCMDQDGNIDAFRYIEYSRQRRMEFLRRADFICKMKSTLQMQQQQHQIHRSASLPGTKSSLPIQKPSSTTNEAFSIPPPPAQVVTPEFLSKSMQRRNSSMEVKNGSVPASLRFLPRSASMPFVSSFAMQSNRETVQEKPKAKSESVVEESIPRKRRSLRKEEFEAAEALLFGMGRRSSGFSESGKNQQEEHACVSPTASKKRKVVDLPLRTEELGSSVLSVVSTEEETTPTKNSSSKTAP